MQSLVLISIVATPTIQVATIPLADENVVGMNDFTGMALTTFEIEPHCDTVRFDVVENYAKQNKRSIYALSANAAISVENEHATPIGEDWRYFTYI